MESSGSGGYTVSVSLQGVTIPPMASIGTGHQSCPVWGRLARGTSGSSSTISSGSSGSTGSSISGSGEAAQTVLKDLDRQIPVLEELDLPEELIPDYLLNPKMDMPTQEVDGRKYIGRIEIPVVEMSLPVMDSWSYENLREAPCRYKGSAYLDDLILAAHNYTRHFGPISQLVPGDEVTSDRSGRPRPPGPRPTC